jgi:uncharacterized protein YndB with AHSA1/START domain
MEAVMATIINSIDVDRSPAEVFAYLDQLDRHGEWQDSIVSTKEVTEGPVRVGSRATDQRRVPGGRKMDVTYEIVEHDPPRRMRFEGVSGPVRPTGTVTVDPLDDGARSRIRLELDFRGHGIGKLLAPVARRQAAKLVPADQRRLKERLDAGA